MPGSPGYPRRPIELQQEDGSPDLGQLAKLAHTMFQEQPTRLDMFAMRAPPRRLWDFKLEDETEPPQADVIPDGEYNRLAAESRQLGLGVVQRVRNQDMIDLVYRMNEQRKLAAWPWVWARAVLAERPESGT